MKKFLFLVLLSFMLSSIETKAQAVLGISPFSVTIASDTVVAGTSDTIYFWVVNSGTSAFNDSINIYVNVQDSSSAFIYYSIDTVHISTTSIPVNDSVLVSLVHTYIVAPLKFHYDINVIVIWPVALTAVTGDSLVYTEVILRNTGVDEISMEQLINAYPNPFTGSFVLENKAKITIEEVRIYDSAGRLIQTEKNPAFICTDKWKTGAYLIRIQFKNKQTGTVRVIKQ